MYIIGNSLLVAVFNRLDLFIYSTIINIVKSPPTNNVSYTFTLFVYFYIYYIGYCKIDSSKEKEYCEHCVPWN